MIMNLIIKRDDIMSKEDIINRYMESTKKSRELYDRAVKVMPGGNTRGVVFFRPYPAYAKRAKGSRIWDLDGNERIDYCFNYGPLILGHNHPEVIRAAKEQLECGTVFGAPTEKEIELAEKITKLVPSAEKVRFTASGTEAVINAFRVARAYTGKDKIAKFEGGFHGTSDAAWISLHPSKDLAGPVSSPNAVPDSDGIPEGVVKDMVIMQFNDTQATEAVIKRYKDELAAVIIEPIQIAGGGFPAKEEFLKVLREITERYSILLILDEVITGFRLAPAGGEEYFKVKPDMSIFGKIIGGGFPIGAFSGREDVMDMCSFPECSFPEFRKPRVPSSGTWNAYPISLAAGLAQLNELKPKDYEHINKLGHNLRTGLTKLLSDLNIKGVTVGTGSIFHVFFTEEKEIARYRDTLSAEPRILRYFDLDLLNRGVYLAPEHACNISVATTDKDIEQTLKAMKQTLIAIKPIIREIAPNLIIK